MDDPVVSLLREASVQRADAVAALRHLPLPVRQGLAAEDHETRRRSEGRFFEAIIYELLRKAGAESPLITAIAAFGADLPEESGSKNGIRYTRDGNIRICRDGVIAAEIDLLFSDTRGRIFFGEATIAPPPASFINEVREKKALLSDLAAGREIIFLYLSPSPPPAGLAPLFEEGGYPIIRPDLLTLREEVAGTLTAPRKKRRPMPHPKVTDGAGFFSKVPEEQGFFSYIQRFFRK